MPPESRRALRNSLIGIALILSQHWALPQLRAQTSPDTSAHVMGAMPPGPLGIPGIRMGSGTSWLPDATPMYMHHWQADRLELMLHYNVFVQYIREGSRRGDDQFGSINWVMGMTRLPLGGGWLWLRPMLSLERLTVGRCGYPDLLATGETCHGEPLVDRQHPHDLIMELAAIYLRAFTRDVAGELYLAVAGEPALGPTAYPHRPSALPNPLAPITHHWIDATHIAFGVVTAGVFGRRWKAEVSLFNGREPDENRFDIDLATLDSYSGRLSFLPGERWALPISGGHLEDAEASPNGEPPATVHRFTASAIYHRPLRDGGIWATTAVWGLNEEHGHNTNAFLLETNLDLRERDIIFGRAEVVEKAAENFGLPGVHERTFTVGKVSIGYVRQFGPFAGILAGAGGLFSIGMVPDDLEFFYGTKLPTGLAIYLRGSPAPMRMEATHPMHPPAPPHHEGAR